MRTIILFILLTISALGYGQVSEITLNPEKVKKFQVYMIHKHGGPEGFDKWKAVNKLQYSKEMWYYSESFYIKRNHLSEGVTLNEEIIDISRFESSRKENEEVTIVLPGFKDVLVLIPGSKLIYKL